MSKQVLRDLGDGLVLRRASAEDVDALCELNANVLRDPDEKEPNQRVVIITRDLMERSHPTFGDGGFTLVEDTSTGAIVSALCLVPQTWSYGGVEFGVGRPELVATDPQYRRRGLVRAQFEVVHEWSAQLGHWVQAITGIPWFYRQFGYGMALDLGGGREGFRASIPKLKEGAEEPYQVRLATEKDLPFLVETYRGVGERYLVTCVRDKAQWRYELSGRSQENGDRREICVVEDTGGEPVGLVTHGSRLWRQTLPVFAYELAAGVSWLAVTPSILRYLEATGASYEEKDDKQDFALFAFWLETEHPVYDAIRNWIPQTRRPYAWYVRVADLPGFVRHIAPVLESRLTDSYLVGHTGEVKLSFYTDGLRLEFEQGRLKTAEAWRPEHLESGAAFFPDHTFLQLLFGFRTLEELRRARADCWGEDNEARALLEVLFPRQASHVWPLM